MKNYEVLESEKSLNFKENLQIQRDVKKIISEMFAFGRNIKFSGGLQNVEFEIDFNDYKLGYSEELSMDYTEGVAKKRNHQVALKFDSKSKSGTVDKPIYQIKFKIKLT